MQTHLSPFFSTPDLAGLIQQLKHLSLFSANALVVEGEAGSGKTTLLKELFNVCETQSSEASIDLAHMQCRADVSIDNVLSEAISELGLGEAEYGAGEALILLRSYAERLITDKKITVLALDDAHFLGDDSLGGFLSLLDVSGDGSFGLRVIFFTEPGLMSRIDEIAAPDLSVYDFQLSPFSTAELERFLADRVEGFEEQQLSGKLPSTAAIWNRSHGLPGPALTLVEEEIKPETTQRAFTEYRGVPLFHLITAAALITVLVLFLLYDSDEPERAVDSPIVIETISPESAISAGPAAPKPAKIKVDQDVLGASDLSEPSPESGPERDSKLDEAADSNPVNTLLVADAATIAEDANAESGNDIVLAESESAAAPSDAVESIPLAAKDSKEDKPESVSSQVEIDSNPIPITEPARAISEQDRALKQSEDFLMAQSSGYVLQLVAASQKTSLLDYVARQPNKEMLHIYRRVKDADSAWFIVVIGPFDSKSEAERARAGLPEPQRNAGPWPRNIEAVRGEIAEFRRK